jgi:hypothetical protein
MMLDCDVCDKYSFGSTVFLLYETNVIAIALLFLTTISVGVQAPQATATRASGWYEIFLNHGNISDDVFKS